MDVVIKKSDTRMGGGHRMNTTAIRVAVVVLILALAGGTAALLAGGKGMKGKYEGADGKSVLEFRGSRVYVTSSLGTTYVAGYEVDGDRVIIRGAGGAQVYTKSGDTLDGGVGIRFVKQD